MQTMAELQLSWGSLRKLVFRFCFLYFAIYIFFTPNNELPLINSVYNGLNNLLHQFIPWFAKTFFRYKTEITVFTNGSGDTSYDYLLWFFGNVLTVAGTIIWTLIDRKRQNYNTLYYWIRVIVRYYLFYTMISYGIFKVIKIQFPFPSIFQLVEPYGDSSPMGLAWNYMGYSISYNYFTGIAEILSGVLLLFRKTTTVGALLCLGVMINVFMINMGYDVPVKLLSFNTILMNLFLLSNDMKRLLNFFISNKPTSASNIDLPYANKKLRFTLITLKWLFVAVILWMNLKEALDLNPEYGENAPKSPLYGIYYTQVFLRNNDSIPPLETDTTRWKRIIFEGQYADIQSMNDKDKFYRFSVDTVAKTVLIYPNSDTSSKTLFRYTKDSNYLSISGKMKNDLIFIKLKKFDRNRFTLVNRGFHWVNEYPFNR